jgi:hypothetical protein
MYSKVYTDEDAMRQMEPIFVDSTTDAAYTYAKAEFVTADSLIGFTSEYYAPSDPDTCEFVVCIQTFAALKSGLTGIFIGDFFDFDVPSDSGSNNGSGFDVAKQLIYQFGGEYGQDDSTEAFCAQESDARYAGVYVDTSTVVKNMMTVDNGTYVYTTTSPWGVEAPLPPGPTYELMKLDGFSTWSSTAPESLYTDLSTLITFGQYDLAIGSPVKVIKVFITTKDYYAGFWDDIYDKSQEWIAGHGIRSCCQTPGDANDDGVVNVGDAVYVINYVFKGGPTPPCLQQADANGDGVVNVGDAVYVINYVFKGGPAPLCGP